jgi:PBP1b-binding outer membrane lipoprotein LpoB
MRPVLLVLLAMVLLVSGCTSADRTEVSHMGEMKISSPAFADMADIENAMTGHILETATLTGLYQKR